MPELPSLITRAASNRRHQQRQEEYQPTTQEEQSLLGQIGGGFLSGLGMVGNLLDLPGSTVRDLIVGQPAFDQWATPFSFDNRSTGREVLSKFGMRKNRETGIGGWVDDPGEGLRDVAGFGAEVLLDPLTYLTFGGAALGKAGQVMKRAHLTPTLNRLRKGGMQAGTLSDNARNLISATAPGKAVGPRAAKQTFTLDDLIRNTSDPQAARAAAQRAAEAMGESLDNLGSQTLGKQFGLGLPFQDPLITFNAPGGQMLSRAMDAVGEFVGTSWPARQVRALFDRRVQNQSSRVGQHIAELGSEATAEAAPEAAKRYVDDIEAFGRLQQQFDQAAGGNLLPPDSQFHPHDINMELQQVDDYRQAVQEYERWQGMREFRRRHPEWVQANREGDFTTIPNYDTSWSNFFGPPDDLSGLPGGQYFDSLGNDIPDPQALWDILGDPNHPSLTRQYPRMRDYRDQAIEQLRQRGLQTPFQQRQVVRLRRGQTGYVIQPGMERSTIFTREPTTGRARTYSVRNADIEAMPGTPEELAEMSSQQQQMYSRMISSDLLRGATEYGEDVGEGAEQAFRANAERAFRDIHPGIANHLEEQGLAPQVYEQFNQMAENLKRSRDELHEKIRALGGKASWLDEAIKHYPRYTDPRTQKEMNMGRVLPSRHGSMRRRTLETAGLPFHIRDEILENPRYRGEGAADRIFADFEDYLKDNWGREADPDAFDVDMFEGLDDAMSEGGRAAHAQALADWAQGKPHLRMTGDAMEDHSRYIEKGTATLESINALQDVAARWARSDIEGTSLGDAFRQMGLRADEAKDAFMRRTGMTRSQVDNLRLPDEFIKGATGVIDYIKKGPEWHSRVGDLIDGFTRWFKTYVTVPFPGFVSRNFSSGQHLNIATSAQTPADVGRYVKQMGEAKAVMERVRKAFKTGQELDPADRELMKELFAHRVVDRHFIAGGVETPGGISAPSGNPLEEILPGEITDWRGHREKAAGYVEDYPMEVDIWDTTQSRKSTEAGRPESWAFDDLPLVSRMRRGARTVVEAGTSVNKQAEWFNRVPLYLYFKNKGYSPAQAAQEVLARHFDYGDLSDFERSVAKRIFPFYTFSRKILGLVSKELMEKPGGGLGQTIRASNRAAGGNDRPLPQYVRETSAIPWGEADDGTMRYLTGLGLAHEDPLSFLGGGFQGALVEGISRSNPLIKGPLEWATGESFFQRGPMGGRDLADMDPVVGRLLTNVGLQEEDPLSGRAKPFISGGFEHLAANSPITRFLTTARQITDKRKRENPILYPGDALTINMLTGMKTTDISPAAQDAVLRDALTPILLEELGGRAYTNIYIPKDAIQDAEERGDFELANRMRAARTIQKMLQDRAKRRKKEREATERR